MFNSYGRFATTVYVIGLFCTLSMLFGDAQLLGPAALMSLGTLGDIRLSR